MRTNTKYKFSGKVTILFSSSAIPREVGLVQYDSPSAFNPEFKKLCIRELVEF